MCRAPQSPSWTVVPLAARNVAAEGSQLCPFLVSPLPQGAASAKVMAAWQEQPNTTLVEVKVAKLAHSPLVSIWDDSKGVIQLQSLLRA